MSVWLCIPSKRPRAEAQACIEAWRVMGYSTAIRRDFGDEIVDCDHLQYGAYEGYANACNGLIRDVMKIDTDAQWFVCAGDDTLPDPKRLACEIATSCTERFDGKFGVMQPTGDRFADGSIDRIAGSPWIGREFAERAYGGNGPYWPEYRHMFVDEEIMCVAQKLGVFWQRPDICQLHRHFMRESDAIDSRAIAKAPPSHLVEANSPAHWTKYQGIFRARKAAGFPGHEPIAA